MKSSRCLASAALAAMVIGSSSPAAAQGPTPEELKAEVPALTAMHDVIRPMWHDAWPNKDYKALAEFLPQIERHMKAIVRAELPGILRDKGRAWTDGVSRLREVVTDYGSAVKAGNNDDLLKEAERLHSSYEALVRIVRPVLKEMDDFHSTLYLLYHYQVHPYQIGPIVESAKILKEKMGPLTAAVLPERLKARTPAFDAQRARLSKAVDRLLEVSGGRDEFRVKEAIELLHVEYEKLEKVFE